MDSRNLGSLFCPSLYSYEKGGRPGYVVYFWQGSESSQDERAASAICAMQVPLSLPSLPQSFPLVLAFIPHTILATVLAPVLACYVLPFVCCQAQNLADIDLDIL